MEAWPQHSVEVYLLPGVALDLRELELGVVGVHLADLFPCRRTQHLDDLDQLVHARVSREDWLAQQQLSQYAACTPHVYRRDRGGLIEVPSANYSCAHLPMLVV